MDLHHSGGAAPAVAVWADYWLPLSETFIAHQIAAMRRWSPVCLGFAGIDGLPVVPDLAPFTRSFSSRIQKHFLGTRAHLSAYANVLEERKVLLLHAHFGPGAINLLPLARRSSLPLVVTFHGYDVTRLPRQTGVRGRLYRRGLSAVFQRADRLIAVSRHIANQLLKLGAPESKISVRYIGAPIPPAPPDAPTRLWPKRTGIAFVGRLVEKKGVDDLLRAVAALPGELRATPVTILGTGERQKSLQRLADDLGVEATFRGSATPEQVAAALTNAAIFCGPSKTAADGDTEGLPISLIEAANYGAPIVSTHHAGIPEFVRDGEEAMLVNEGDFLALSAALAALLTDQPLAHALAARAMARARAEFDIDKCTAALESLYDDVRAGV